MSDEGSARRDRASVRNSKFLSFVLRHEPEAIGLTLDRAGWVAVDELLAAAAEHGRRITREELEQIVAGSDKQRFALSADGQQIRASQGHSVEVELGYEARIPPTRLFHGTAAHKLAPIREKGLLRGQRHHVHLSADAASARRVGSRHGAAVVLTVLAKRMHHDGHAFFRSDNGVWLVEHVPPQYLAVYRGGDEEDDED